MPFELGHNLTAARFAPKLRKAEGFMTGEVELRGSFTVLFPGRLVRETKATFRHLRKDSAPPSEGSGGGTAEPHGGIVNSIIDVPLTLKLFTPDGREFTASQITLADLRLFRDARGAPSGQWSYLLTGKSEPVEVQEDSVFKEPGGFMRLGLIETVVSESAPPLIGNVSLTAAPKTFEFDLFRVGTFTAKISLNPLLAQWRGTMRLIDPDGAVRTQSTSTSLSLKVGLPDLRKSRDATGQVRKWKLEVTPQTTTFGGLVRLHATVIGTGRITIAALQSRIDAMLGPRGTFARIFGEDKNGEARARLQITDIVAAETLDMHGLLDQFTPDSPAAEISINTLYTMGSISDDFGFGIKLRVGGLKVESIVVTIGPGVALGASVPTLHLGIAVSGKALIKLGSVTVADIEVPGGRIDIEIGIKLSSDGTPEMVTAVPDTLFDGDLSAGGALALAPLLAGLGAIAADQVVDSIVGKFNDGLVKSIREFFSDPVMAPLTLMTIFGAHLTYQPFRFEGDEICFDHIAPLEPEPRPRDGYLGVAGRNFTTAGDVVRFIPPLLPDTWKADNLARIEHIVVVMMENRSYDHVLGFRAAADGSDGLTTQMIASVESTTPFKIRNLKDAQFEANKAGLMTRLPVGVGHEFVDVAQQLSGQIPGPNGRSFNDPKGFVDNFIPRLKQPADAKPHGVVPDDVLGFYDDSQLKFFKFLAENYAYSDQYYCSHPGPTLPNRMYSLTGDLQYDRYGFPIIANNNGDNFLLSRAPTIYDVLARHGKSFRVYESAPSVSMLRMFARYSSDTANIVPLGERAERLRADASAGNLPALTVVEPAMHHHPQNDDHPDADMLRGQQFLKQVYDALSQGPRWDKTLLIITYDEHGGLYDHVVPPVAEFLPTSGGIAIHPGGGTPNLGNSAAARGLLPVRFGVRVPTFVVSPWTMVGKGPNLKLDHCSILKTVLARFLGAEKPFLSDRVHISHSFNAFLTAPAPRIVRPPDDLPDLPTGERIGNGSSSSIITPPLSRRRMRAGPVDFHDISGRWARQLGR